MLMADLFADRRDEVSLFSNSAEALDHIRTDRTVSLLITSLEVTPFDGLELCWHARLAAGPTRPFYIAVMSSSNDEENLAKVLDSGADDLIPKPVSRRMLYAKLRLAGRLHTAQSELVRLAETDPLTEVLNRGAFFRRLASTFEFADGSEPIWAAMIDFDRFKKVNDTQGHHIGDKVIRSMAAEASRMSGIVGRLGGDEFGLLIQGPAKTQAVQIADNFRQRCANLVFNEGNGPFGVTCSVGLSRWVAGDTPDLLLRRADKALYEAKAAGRNQVKVFEAVR
jgi:diguanylate cyclase (GGDEF)-like protein